MVIMNCQSHLITKHKKQKKEGRPSPNARSRVCRCANTPEPSSRLRLRLSCSPDRRPIADSRNREGAESVPLQPEQVLSMLACWAHKHGNPYFSNLCISALIVFYNPNTADSPRSDTKGRKHRVKLMWYTVILAEKG